MLVSHSNLENIQDLEKKSDFFDDLNLSHSRFQIENFILGGEQGVTLWGKYKQCLREVHARFQSLKEINYRIAKKKIEIKKLEHKKCSCNIEVEERLIDIEYQTFGLASLENSKEEILKEGAVFLENLNALKQEIDKILESGKTKEDLEKDFWIKKLKFDIECSVLASSGATKGLLQIVKGMEDKTISQEILAHQKSTCLQLSLDNKKIQDKFSALLSVDNQT